MTIDVLYLIQDKLQLIDLELVVDIVYAMSLITMKTRKVFQHGV